MKKITHKLALKKVTIHNLSRQQAANVRGGTDIVITIATAISPYLPKLPIQPVNPCPPPGSNVLLVCDSCYPVPDESPELPLSDYCNTVIIPTVVRNF
jgi:hypothetical protein